MHFLPNNERQNFDLLTEIKFAFCFFWKFFFAVLMRRICAYFFKISKTYEFQKLILKILHFSRFPFSTCFSLPIDILEIGHIRNVHNQINQEPKSKTGTKKKKLIVSQAKKNVLWSISFVSPSSSSSKLINHKS